MRKNTALPLAIGILAMAAAALPSYAVTAPALQLADSSGDVVTIDATNTVTFSAGCACTTTSYSVGSGTIMWTGTIGPFTVNSASGQTKPAISPPSIDIGVGSVTTAGVGGTLTISWTDVGFSGSTPAAMTESTTFQAGTGSVTYTSYVDDTNAPFGTGITVGTITTTTTSNQSLLGLGPISDPYSMTNVEAITLSANAIFINDYSLQTASYPALSLTCPVSSGQVGTAYSGTIGILGGVSPYTFSIIGTLPAGLVLNANGTITGTPTTATVFPTPTFTIKVMDSSGFVGSNIISTTCGIAITGGTITGSKPTLACPGLTTIQAGVYYNSSFVAASGMAPYGSFKIASGSLPTGFTINAISGAVTGTFGTSVSSPTTFTFTGSALDSSTPPQTATSSSCTITITPPPTPMTLTCAGTAGTVGTAYSSALMVSGGTGPYKYSIISGSLPAGLKLTTISPAATGTSDAITGTPSAPGTSNYTFQVVDASGNTVSGTSTKSCSIGIINPQIAPLSVLCPLGTATVGVAYSSTVPVTGGVSPYTFSLSAGSLPAGLSLNTTTGAITGTPTSAGTSGFTIKVTDSAKNTATSTCSGTCGASVAASINFNSPTGNLGNSHAYVVSGVTITAYGFTNSGSPTSLDGQNNYGVQNDGLGINSVSNGQIDTNNFVQLDLGAAITAGATNFQLLISGINQCQNGESYDVYGSNTLGSIGTLIVSAGTKDSTFFPVSLGTYRYLSVRAHWGNVLLGEISFSLPGTTCSITVAPAPAPKISLKKTANVSSINPFQSVTYTYVVTNTGTFTINNIKVTDDNATPSYTGDDFTVGTIATLAPGASATLTATVIPPVSEGGTSQSWNGWGNNGWGNNNNGWGNNTPTTAGTLICSKLSNGNYQIIFRQDPSQTDNTYGRGSSSSWAGQQRNFSDMLSGQAAEFRFLDANGNTVLDVATDYISQSRNFPSGYGTLGIGGGNGGVISGNGSHVVSCDTTLSHNLNQSSSFYQCTQNSPSSSSWDNVSGYTIVVDGKTFGSAGWGGVAIPDCHNQNSIQQGCNDQKVSPVSSSSTNTATVTGTASDGITVSATATATVKINASSSSWSQCSKY